ncbi:MAG: alpha-N-acetylglucosaminidase [Phycisphaerae bacterium]|nr:alpha-N-acetylglucosaminidase [Phycisphaerae bacterium]
MKRVPAILLVLLALCTPTAAQAAGPEAAARGVLTRLLPAEAEHFELTIIPQADGRDVFEIESRNAKIVLRGSSGVSICSALNWYLKYHCHASVSWTGNQLRLPTPLPVVQGVIRRPSPHLYRYFFNYCAFSYSLAWWDWPEWERMIDWMALNGVNAPLAITGQEATWQAVFRDLGLADTQIAEFIAGPAYLPFGWMGCVDGWGGPLPQHWIDRHRELQIKILTRERDLGMTPILQGFTGHVPKAIQEQFPMVRLQQASPWCGFPATWFIDPMDPFFQQVGKAFIEEQTRQYGTDHLYASDTFIEMSPPSNDPAYLAGMGRAVYGAMASADPEAIWFLQGWIFPNNPSFWKPPQARGLFSGIPKDRLVLIEMTGDTWKKTEAFYGQPWLWALIQDFGGVVSLHGDLGGLLDQLEAATAADKDRQLRGIGIIMESLGYNAVFDDLLLEMTWRTEKPEIGPWLADYAHRRYGRSTAGAEQAWNLMLTGPHRRPRAATAVICDRPTLQRNAASTSTDPNSHMVGLVSAIQRLLECEGKIGDQDTFRFDLVNMTRQALSNESWILHGRLVNACKAKDRQRLADAGRRFLELIRDMDELLATRREFLLGPWLADAKRWATRREERRLYEWNARNQITLWGSKDSPLNDYAQKQWSGLLTGFYLPRWQQFLARLDKALEEGRETDMAAWERDIRAWEEKWTRGTEAYSTEPSGDSLAVVRRLCAKWFMDPSRADSRPPR